jgi:hypothetical protein
LTKPNTKLYLISHGDSKLAFEWLAEIIVDIAGGKSLNAENSDALASALLGIVKRGEASRFWNQGKEPNKRKSKNFNRLENDMGSWIEVKIKLMEDPTISLAIACDLVADSRVSPINQEIDDDDYTQADEIQKSYLRASREFLNIREKRAAESKQQSKDTPSPFFKE